MRKKERMKQIQMHQRKLKLTVSLQLSSFILFSLFTSIQSHYHMHSHNFSLKNDFLMFLEKQIEFDFDFDPVEERGDDDQDEDIELAQENEEIKEFQPSSDLTEAGQVFTKFITSTYTYTYNLRIEFNEFDS